MMTQERKFYYIEDMSAILGKTAAAIHGHLARRQYDAVPPPVKIGRRQAWLVEAVEEWINAKVVVAREEVERQMEFLRANPVKRGRPTKTEEVRKRKEQQDLEVLKRLSQSLEGEETEYEGAMRLPFSLPLLISSGSITGWSVFPSFVKTEVMVCLFLVFH